MNTIMINDNGRIRVTDNDEILSSTIASLARNNTFCPSISRVIYSTSEVTKKDSDGKEIPTGEYVLATTVFFADNTKVTVKNSMHDKISICTEKVSLPDGTEKEVKTASVESREAGLVYAIVKRMICTPDSNGSVSGAGLANFLRKQVGKAWNQNIEDVKTKALKKIKNTKKSEAPVKKTEKPSLRKCVQVLSDIITKLDSKLSK